MCPAPEKISRRVPIAATRKRQARTPVEFCASKRFARPVKNHAPLGNAPLAYATFEPIEIPPAGRHKFVISRRSVGLWAEKQEVAFGVCRITILIDQNIGDVMLRNHARAIQLLDNVSRKYLDRAVRDVSAIPVERSGMVRAANQIEVTAIETPAVPRQRLPDFEMSDYFVQCHDVLSVFAPILVCSRFIVQS